MFWETCALVIRRRLAGLCSAPGEARLPVESSEEGLGETPGVPNEDPDARRLDADIGEEHGLPPELWFDAGCNDKSRSATTVDKHKQYKSLSELTSFPNTEVYEGPRYTVYPRVDDKK